MVLLAELMNDARKKYGYYEGNLKCTKQGGSRSQTGFSHVYKRCSKTTRKGYTFTYRIQQDNIVITFSSVNLLVLHHEVKRRGLPWRVSDVLLAQRTVADENLNWEDFYE